jgi:hypothetical protein
VLPYKRTRIQKPNSVYDFRMENFASPSQRLIASRNVYCNVYFRSLHKLARTTSSSRASITSSLICISRSILFSCASSSQRFIFLSFLSCLFQSILSFILLLTVLVSFVFLSLPARSAFDKVLKNISDISSSPSFADATKSSPQNM